VHEPAQHLGREQARRALPDEQVHEPLDAELLTLGRACLDHAVGVEQHAVARLERQLRG
jgi:hypothetical protein